MTPTPLTTRQTPPPSENDTPDRAGRAPMSRRHHMPRRLVAALLATLAIAAPALAQADTPPSPELAMNAYAHVDQWVRSWKVPDQQPEDLPPIHAATLTLRFGGNVISRDTLFDDDADVLLPLARHALEEGLENLHIEKDVFHDRRLTDNAQRVTISLELAGPLVPMNEASDFERELALNPGLEGIAVRYEGKIEAMSPGTMLATDTTPGAALNILRGRLIKDPALLLQPERIKGATYYRFRTTHVAQADAGGAPMFLHRGGRVVPLAAITEPALIAMADDMARNLIKHQWTGAERFGMYATFHPTSGDYDPIIAPPASQALCAYALVRYSTSPGADPKVAFDAREFARKLLSDLGAVEGDEDKPWDTPHTAAMCVIACAELQKVGERPPDDAASLEALCRDEVARMFDADSGFDVALPLNFYALVAFAMTEVADTPEQRALATKAVRKTYELTPPDELAAQMPWLGWAELSLVGSDPVPAAAALREMRERIWQDQFTGADAGFGDQDLVGGLVLTAGSLNPLPSWHTARRIALLATMLGDSRLTSAQERSAEIVRLLRAVRFIRQLMVDEAVGHMCRSPLRAKGGIRSSLWDQRMPPDATAFSLMSVTELLRSLQHIKSG